MCICTGYLQLFPHTSRSPSVLIKLCPGPPALRPLGGRPALRPLGPPLPRSPTKPIAGEVRRIKCEWVKSTSGEVRRVKSVGSSASGSSASGSSPFRVKCVAGQVRRVKSIAGEVRRVKCEWVKSTSGQVRRVKCVGSSPLRVKCTCTPNASVKHTLSQNETKRRNHNIW